MTDISTVTCSLDYPPPPPVDVPASAAAGSSPPNIDTGIQDLTILTDLAADALNRANSPERLFQQGGRLVRLEAGDDGEPLLRTLTPERTKHEMARAAKWVRYRDKQRVEYVQPPMAVVRDYLALPSHTLPVLTRIVEAPVFAADGTLQTSPGYHPSSRTYYSPTKDFLVHGCPDSPSDEDIRLAVSTLADDLLGDFPFVGPAEKAHAIALLLLPFARDLICGPTPLHLIEKPCPGTGATLLVDVLTYPATGRPLHVITEADNDEEWRKRITAVLRSGTGFVVIDNLGRRLDSASLSSAITAPTWGDRLLGTSDTVSMPVNVAWVATGNNPGLSNEISRRCVRIRLDAQIDKPWIGREYRHPNLKGWLSENREQVVWSALTLIQSWIVGGKPRGKIRLGMFESWSETMGGIFDVAGIPGFLGNIHEFYEQSDSETNAIQYLVQAWWRFHQDNEVVAGDLWNFVEHDSIDLNLGVGSDRAQRNRSQPGKE